MGASPARQLGGQLNEAVLAYLLDTPVYWSAPSLLSCLRALRSHQQTCQHSAPASITIVTRIHTPKRDTPRAAGRLDGRVRSPPTRGSGVGREWW